MSCSSCYLSLSSEKSRKLMYGPLYDKYAHSALADIHLKRTFSNERSLIPQYVPDCCAYVSTNFRGSAHWKLYAILLGVWFVYAGIMLAAFLSIRKTQLVKIRGTRATIAYLFTVAAMLSTTLLFAMAAGSDPKFIVPVLMLIFIPFYLFLPILKSLQVLFIYKWHEAKAKRLEYLNWFTRWKFVLSIRFYLAASLAMFLVVVVPLTVSLFLVSPAFIGHGRTSFSSLRCSWWHIPDELTVATTNSSMCGCIRAAFLAEGDEQLLCEEGFLATCFSASSTTTALESELCTTCSSALTTGSTSSECEDAFITFYASGACGFPSRTPYFDSCVVGVFADQRIMFALYSVCFALIALHILVIAPLVSKRDYFGTILESMLTLLNSTPPITSMLLYFQFPVLVSWWPSALPFFVVVPVAAVYIMPMITLGVPIFLHIWRKKRNLGSDVFSSKQVGAVKPLTVESSSETVVLPTHDPNETAVQQCIASEPLRTVYVKFSVEEFTTENVRFLEECMQTLANFSSYFNSADLVTQVQRLYDQFIATGSDMEVNVPWSLKTRVQRHLETVRATSAPNIYYVARTTRTTMGNSRRPSLALSLEDIANSTAEELLLDAVKDAFMEVTRLMARSSWPRFKESRYYPEFLERKSELQRRKIVDVQVMAWLGNEPTPDTNPNPNPNPNPNHNSSHHSDSDTDTEFGQATTKVYSPLTRHSSTAAMEIVAAGGAEDGLSANPNPNPNPNPNLNNNPNLSRKSSFNLLQLLGHRREGTLTLTPDETPL